MFLQRQDCLPVVNSPRKLVFSGRIRKFFRFRGLSLSRWGNTEAVCGACVVVFCCVVLRVCRGGKCCACFVWVCGRMVMWRGCLV